MALPILRETSMTTLHVEHGDMLNSYFTKSSPL